MLNHLFTPLLLMTLTAASIPCIPDGETSVINVTPPAVGGTGASQPAEWADGSGQQPAVAPKIFENDPLHDDQMGDGDWANGEVQIPITNTGGTLSGPNGEGQNGGTEGDCIEVYPKIPYWYQVTVTETWGYSIFGASVGSSETKLVWRLGWFTMPDSQVCPC
jgi:hypothetical protein